MMLLEILALKELNRPVEIPQPKSVQTVQVETKPKPKPKAKTYKIKRGDNLSKLSKRFRVPVVRLLCANPKITDPDQIQAGDRLRIPQKKDKLKCATIKSSNGSLNAVAARNSPRKSGGFSSSNTYEPGQCVWYIKNLRPEIPNTWGNATDWLYNAQAQGWPTGSSPRVGAVGWTYGHVVLITGVSGGTVSYTDMNGRWIPFEINSGTAAASKYQYIY